MNKEGKKPTVHVGQRFGKLVVLSMNDKGHWVCACDCGNTTTTDATRLHGGKKGCRCLKQRWSLHGEGGNRLKTVEYTAWATMRQRCLDKNYPKYRDYGGRGITVCDRWLTSYVNFLADMGRKPSTKHSLDRIDVNGNYEPTNCRWATPIQQQRNRRDNTLITIDGVTHCVETWAELRGIPSKRLAQRVRSGWPVSELFSPPSQRKRIKTGFYKTVANY